jgi:hypothetical protein
MCDGTKTIILSRLKVTIVWDLVHNRIYWVLNERKYKSHSAIPNSHNLQFTAARTIPSQPSVSSPVAC